MQALAIATPAFFIALTTIAGRSYVLIFYQTLGIPLSEIDHSALDYALASPSVLTYVLTITLAFAGLQWWMLKWPNTGNESWKEVFLPGTIAIASGILLGFILPHITPSLETPLTELRGASETLHLILIGGGFGVLSHSVFAKQLVNEEPGSARKLRHTPIMKLLVVVTIATLIYGGVAILWETPGRMGREDAEAILTNPTLAEMVIDTHPQCATGCSIGVVMTNNKFVYVRSDVGVTAYPLSLITKINYDNTN